MLRARVVLILALLPMAAAGTEKPPEPGIHGPKILGVHPRSPFLYTIPATGVRPMRFSVRGLPKGLSVDGSTGRITGTSPPRGSYSVVLRAQNAHGHAERTFRIESGDRLALTPPMGWSTWYMAYAQISDKLVREQADAMVSSGLINHGYTYINIDDGWNVKPGSPDPQLSGPARDAQGDLIANRNFPDMRGLCAYVHSKGLKIGIYIGPGRVPVRDSRAAWGTKIRMPGSSLSGDSIS